MKAQSSRRRPPKASSWMNSRSENPCGGAASAVISALGGMPSYRSHVDLQVAFTGSVAPFRSRTKKDCTLAVPSRAAVDTGSAAPPAPNGVSAGLRSIGCVGVAILKEHDQLQREEDDRVDARSAPAGILLP